MKYEPVKLRPCYKEYIWGGDTLKRKYNKEDAPNIVAECWELAVHKDGNSIIDNGEYKGQTLNVFFNDEKNAYFGTKCKSRGLPVLIKMIDAKRDLSIQVHPSDDNAEKALGEDGKTEMWYVADCESHAKIYYGFSEKISRKAFVDKAKDGSICDVMNSVSVKKGDVFFVKPGTIHAIGEGVVIVEIQQNSNTTFRVFDFNRKDNDGNSRQLHIDRAQEVVELNPIIPKECKINCEVQTEDFILSEMFSCQYFSAYRIDVLNTVSLTCDGTSFHHILCIDGNGLVYSTQSKLNIRKGDSYFMPASMGDYRIEGNCQLILSKL